jgi:glycosyltransferase involved in cell wall biosynthesis
MPSVVIAAHNEEFGIGACLDRLSVNADPALEVTVVANGCTDRTAEVAASYVDVRVIDLPTAGKSAALNAADAVSSSFPRVYLDADIALWPADIRKLCAVLSDAVHAAVPRRVLAVGGRPLAVRAYYAVNARLPAFETGLFGRGAIALSETGRRRFGSFPSAIADDLFLDSLFDEAERAQARDVASVVETPTRTVDLVRRLVRVRHGNARLRALTTIGGTSSVRGSQKTAWLRVVVKRPWLIPAGLVYVAITVAAALGARRSTVSWGQDHSSRQAAKARLASEVGYPP